MKEFLLRLLRKLTLYLEKLNKGSIEKTSTLNTLAPKILTDPKDLEKVQPYLTRLKQAIETEGINNIALTGNYGSGKSTILRTFQFQNVNTYHFLNISLASFKDAVELSEENDNSQGNLANSNHRKDYHDQKFQRKLEISILQQIFYHVKPSKIPDSRFKRIVNLTTRKLLFYSISLILWLLSVLIIFKFQRIDKLNPTYWNPDYPIDWIALLSIALFLIGISFFIKALFRLFSNSKISKLSIKGELELGSAIEKSVFNQHLEEILYFFERTKFNIVVIEDLDRFNNTDIFTKLREINILINNSNSINRNVKFIYAVRDEVFQDKNERVKFFEFIIPVIPFINPSNANEQLEKLIRDEKLEGVLSIDFTSDVVTFIDDIDMRLLLNIFHEFLLYRETLSSELNQDSLLSIIVFKNLYPEDFGLLAKRQGELYIFFSNKKIYLQELLGRLEIEIHSADHEIELLEKETVNSLEEFRAIYVLQIVRLLNKFHAFNINGNQVSITDSLKEENWKVIRNTPTLLYWYYSYNDIRSTQSSVGLSDVENNVSQITYAKREKLLIDKFNNRINILKQDISKLKQKQLEVEGYSIKRIFEEIDIEAYLGKYKDNLLIRNLLINGYIDEYYDDYISLFHEVSLTKEDFSFERKIKSGFKNDFDYPLVKTETLIKRIPDKYFTRDGILNYNLVEKLIENEHQFSKEHDLFFSGLKLSNERKYKFIYGFLKKESPFLGSFINSLCRYQLDFWEYIKNKSALPDEEIRSVIHLIFEYADVVSILKFSDIESLDNHLLQLPDLFSFSKQFNSLKNLKIYIQARNLKFVDLEQPILSEMEFFNFIYKGNFYLINEHNIVIILSSIKKDIDTEKLKEKNYSIILESKAEELISYIHSNMEIYTKNVLLSLIGNNLEEEYALLKILNNTALNNELKSQSLEKQKNKINSILDVLPDYRELAFIISIVKPDWKNILNNIEEEASEFDDTIINFLNIEENYITLAKQKITYEGKNKVDLIQKASSLLVHSNRLHLESYKYLIKSLPYSYREIQYNKLDVEHLTILINNKILKLTEKNFNGLKDIDSQLGINLIEVHQSSFITQLNELTLDDNDWQKFFTSSVINDSVKVSVVPVFDQDIIVRNEQVAESLGKILSKAGVIPITYEALKSIITAHKINENRIELINKHLQKLNNEQVKILVQLLGYSYRKVFKKQHKPTFTNTLYHRTLFEHLEKNNLIKRFVIIKNGNLRVIALY